MNSPFQLQQTDLYQAWREQKLSQSATDISSLLVSIDNPASPTTTERERLIRTCRVNNMALYAADPEEQNPEYPLRLASSLGLQRLDHNWLGEESGLTLLACREDPIRPRYIPYTNRPIRWHTDGYYNPPERSIRGMLLHCATSADSGGENQLFDPEIAYILLRDENPDYIRALSQADAMSIPAREGEDGSVRPRTTCPVFSLTDTGELHMRFTERKHNIDWKDDPMVEEAVRFLGEILSGHSDYCHTARLEPGMGLICNNVLHNRSGFDPDTGNSPRQLYRGRYLDRIRDTGFRQLLQDPAIEPD